MAWGKKDRAGNYFVKTVIFAVVIIRKPLKKCCKTIFGFGLLSVWALGQSDPAISLCGYKKGSKFPLTNSNGQTTEYHLTEVALLLNTSQMA